MRCTALACAYERAQEQYEEEDYGCPACGCSSCDGRCEGDGDVYRHVSESYVRYDELVSEETDATDGRR